MKRIALAAMLGLMAFAPAQAQTKVTMWHVINTGNWLDVLNASVAEYEAAHPDVDIELQYLENESFKAKLVTALQSNDAPDIFYSWAAGDLTNQVNAGVLRPITSLVPDELRANIGDGGIGAFSRNGEIYGLAQNVAQVDIWYNKTLFSQAGIDPASMSTWSGFLDGVKKFKEAGITPIALGHKDKWPAHFWYAYLVTRIAGQEGFEAAERGEGDGFASADFVEAGNKLLELAQLEPFQDGFETFTHDDANGYFGDGKAAMLLMGDWAYGAQAGQSASGTGIPDDELGLMAFPAVEGGKGDPSDVLGGVNGWIFSKDAPDAAVEFMNWFSAKENIEKYVAIGAFVPIVAGAADALENPFLRQISDLAAKSHWLAIYFDQELGPDVGGVVNDVSAELTANSISAEEAAQLVQDAFANQ